MALILPYEGKSPNIAGSAWLAPTAVVTGDAAIGEDSSIWFGAVLRGDVHWIRVGRSVNIQDNAVCHVTNDDAPLEIEDFVSIGHAAVVHGCTLKRGCLIGIGARVLDKVIVGEQSLVAAGSVVREGTIIPPGELWAGVPAVKKKSLTEEEKRGLLYTAEMYVQYARGYQGQAVEIPLEWVDGRKKK